MSDFTPKWQGYIVTGVVDTARLRADLDACFAGGEISGLVVEPGRIFSAAGGVRKRVEVWNANRTKLKADSECQQPDTGSSEPYVQNYAGNPDVLRIAGGYQVGIRHNGDQSIIVRANPGGGELGAPQGEIPLYPGEDIIVGSSFLDGGRDCGTVLRTINGVPGPTLQIYSDSGVLIGNHPELNRIVISVNGEGLNFCPDVSVPEQVECLGSTGQNCGPAGGVVVNCPGEPDSKSGFKTTGSGSSGTSTNPTPTVGSSQSTSYQQLYGTCQFERTQDGWVQKVNNANFNAHCVPPTTSGYVGQQRTITAVPDNIVSPGYIRNQLFNDGDDHWQLPVGSILVSAENSAKFGNLPYVEFTGVVSQPLVTVPAGRYRLQFEFEVTSHMNIKVFSPRDGITLYEGGLDPQSNIHAFTEFFETPADDITVEFASTSVARITEISLVPWQ